MPPPVPGLLATNSPNGGATEVEKALNRLNLHNAGQALRNPKQPVGLLNIEISFFLGDSFENIFQLPNSEEHDYEEIQHSYQINSPQRPAPKPPVNTALNTSSHCVGTLGAYTELEGVPFVINSMLKTFNQNEVSILKITRKKIAIILYSISITVFNTATT